LNFRRSLTYLMFAILSVVVVTRIGVATVADQSLIMPYSSDDFVDSIGINVRMSYQDWPTSTNWSNPNPEQNIETLLANLGIRHLRDRIPHPQLQRPISYVNPRLAKLYSDYGMDYIIALGIKNDNILDPASLPAYLDWYANGSIFLNNKEILVRDMLIAIEGPNEYDMHNKQDLRDPNWVENLHAYQNQLYDQVKSRSTLKHLPVIAPSLVYTAYCNSVLGSFETTADYGNLHPYPTYPYMRQPIETLGWHLHHVRGCTGNKPIWATETGYLTQNDTPAEISEVTAAKYTPRLLTENFLTGRIKRTYIHEIARANKNGWGIIAATPSDEIINGTQQFLLEPKPSYNAVKSLIYLLSEATWSKSDQLWQIPNIDLNPIPINFQNKEESTHYLLLQKSTGTYYLLLWQELESFNPGRGNFEIDPDEIIIDIPEKMTITKAYEYSSDFIYQEVSLDNNSQNNSLSISVPDSVIVIEFA
jgi:hypothetical protein